MNDKQYIIDTYNSGIQYCIPTFIFSQHSKRISDSIKAQFLNDSGLLILTKEEMAFLMLKYSSIKIQDFKDFYIVYFINSVNMYKILSELFSL